MSLGSNGNYFLCWDGQPLRDLEVIIEVAEDIVYLQSSKKTAPTNPAFTFQLNAYSNAAGDSAWQQFVFTVADAGAAGASLTTLVETWPSKQFAASAGISGDLINSSIHSSNRSQLPQTILPEGKLPAGYQLQIVLGIDSENNVAGAAFYAYDNNKNLLFGKEVLLIDLVTDKPSAPVRLPDLSPVYAFQVNLVGNAAGQTLLKSGAGRIVCRSSNPLAAVIQQPPFTGAQGIVTYETANSVYGGLPATASTTLTQPFGTVYYPVGGFLAAARESGSNRTAVFAIGSTGQLLLFYADGSGSWKIHPAVGPYDFPPAARAFAPPGAPIAVSEQFGIDNQTDIFVVDNTGNLNVFWGDYGGGGTWNGPKPLSGPRFAPAGAHLTACRQFGVTNQTDVFLVDNNGQLCVYWVDGENGWNGPHTISAPDFATPGAPVAACQQFGIAGQTDVFVIDKAGHLNVFWVEGTGAWNGPHQISGAGFTAPQGANIAASQEFGTADQTDVFVVDAAGQLTLFSVNGSGAWSGPKKIGPAAYPDPSGAPFAPPGAPVAASRQFGVPNQTDVFLVDITGQLNVFWTEGGGFWNGPLRISQPGAGNLVAPSGSYIAVSEQIGVSNETDVFLMNNMTPAESPGLGWPCVFQVKGSGQWTGPKALVFQA